MYTSIQGDKLKPVRWVGSSREDLKTLPRPVQRQIGQALYAAQCGEEYPSVKPLKGFGSRSVLEIIATYMGDTFRAVYTIQLPEAIYMLHAFQKKSKRGIATPQRDLELIRRRLADARRHYQGKHN